MVTAPASSSFNQQSLLGVIASIVTVVALGFVFMAIPAPTQVQSSVFAIAVGLPAAVAYAWQGRRRNKTLDAARIAQGELDRPIALVVVMLAAALYVVFEVAHVSVQLVDSWLMRSTGYLWDLPIPSVILTAGGSFMASYASHYLGRHAYLWTTVAVGCSFGLHELVGLLPVRSCNSSWCRPTRSMLEFTDIGLGPDDVLRALAHISLMFLIWLGVCLAGAWYGRKFRHDKFLTKKLVRVERKVEHPAAAPRQSTALDQTSPTDPPAANNIAPQQPVEAAVPDPLDQLKKLADLRDTGALTEEEFQANKAEMLARLHMREELDRLVDMRNAGVFTDEEFQAKKAAILPRI